LLREITSMPAIRDKSVVRSSVIPSARYCCSGSLLRLANGSTTIDRRGATRGCGFGVTAAATTAGGVEDDLAALQPHQTTTAITSTIEATPTVVAMARRRRHGTAI